MAKDYFMKSNQRGFAIVESLLIVVIIGLLGGVGYYVWHAQKQANDTLQAASKVAQSSPGKVVKKVPNTSDLTAGWKTYTSEKGKFTVKYPVSWVQPTSQDACGDFLKSDLEIGPDAQSVIKCGGDGTVSQVSISSQDGDTRNDPANTLSKDLYTINTQGSAAEADGVMGTAIAGNVINQGAEPGIGSFPDGTQVVIYLFYTKGRTYIARYTQYPSTSKEGPVHNELADFNLMTSETLKFE